MTISQRIRLRTAPLDPAEKFTMDGRVAHAKWGEELRVQRSSRQLPHPNVAKYATLGWGTLRIPAGIDGAAHPVGWVVCGGSPRDLRVPRPTFAWAGFLAVGLHS